ncbi:MAG: hypothetical protein EPO02_12790 [Nitrospirae bacterium]|nr:MAG: hypothetical protein EPO02_12790 [Nitrospirota bacterium]
MIMLGALFSALPGLISAGGGLAGLFGGHGKNPTDVANKYLNQIPGQMKPYYDPYMNAGRDSLETLKGQYGNLVNNPGELYNKLGAGYQESPGYANKLKAALQASTNAQAAGGMLGTPAHAESSADIAGNVANQDFEQYLNHVMGLYGQGLAGNQTLETQGQNASQDYGNLVGNVLGQKAQYGYAGQAGKNLQNNNNWSGIAGGLAGANQGYNNYMQNQNLMNWLKSQGQGGF